MIDISIIIATYNSSKTLRKALESVRSQTFQNWECIIVDGASKDNTIDIVKEFEDKDARFRHISEPDNGIYDAFNKGWKMARGTWIYYLGSDDKIIYDSFERMKEDLNVDTAVLTGNVLAEHIDGKIKRVVSKGFDGCHQGKLTKKNVLSEYNGFNEKYKILADYDFYVRIQKDCNVTNTMVDIAYFNIGGASQNLQNFLYRYNEYFYIRKKNELNCSLYERTKYILHKLGSIFYRKCSFLIYKYVK